MSVKRNRYMRQNRRVPDVQEKRKNWGGGTALGERCRASGFSQRKWSKHGYDKTLCTFPKEGTRGDSTPVNATILSSVRLNEKTCHNPNKALIHVCESASFNYDKYEYI